MDAPPSRDSRIPYCDRYEDRVDVEEAGVYNACDLFHRDFWPVRKYSRSFAKTLFDTTETQNDHRDTEGARREILCASVDFCGLCGVIGQFAKAQ